MRHARRTLLVLALLTSGCTGVEDPLSRSETRAFISARARWNNSAVRTAYTYEFRQSCFCQPEITVWNRVTVIDGVVTDVRTERGDTVPRNLWALFPTVDRLFARLETTTDTYLEDITVRFDPQYGYPVEMNFLYGPQIADAGAAYYARNLRAAVR
jgi:Family of unknown function (DUF6174)